MTSALLYKEKNRKRREKKLNIFMPSFFTCLSCHYPFCSSKKLSNIGARRLSKKNFIFVRTVEGAWAQSDRYNSVSSLPKAAERGDEPPRFYEWSAHAFNSSDFCEDEL